jgi:hypothetical protein
MVSIKLYIFISVVNHCCYWEIDGDFKSLKRMPLVGKPPAGLTIELVFGFEDKADWFRNIILFL